MPNVVASGPVIRVIPVKNPAHLVTLDDPAAGAESARDAFARLRPPADYPAHETQTWRDLVATVARAVRVLPSPRTADVPLASGRPDAATPETSVREECYALCGETGDPHLLAIIEELLTQAERQ